MWRFLKFILALPFIYIFILKILDFFYADYTALNTPELSREIYIIILLILIFVFQGIISKISSEKDLFIKKTKSSAYAVFFVGLSLFFICTL